MKKNSREFSRNENLAGLCSGPIKRVTISKSGFEKLLKKTKLPSSKAGGGVDLASKAQILAYYELVLADLQVSLIAL